MLKTKCLITAPFILVLTGHVSLMNKSSSGCTWALMSMESWDVSVDTTSNSPLRSSFCDVLEDDDVCSDDACINAS